MLIKVFLTFTNATKLWKAAQMSFQVPRSRFSGVSGIWRALTVYNILIPNIKSENTPEINGAMKAAALPKPPLFAAGGASAGDGCVFAPCERARSRNNSWFFFELSA
jgi:hypothetical protein